MKKEITEYEQAEKTTTKIQCVSCDKTWDSRDAIEDGDLNFAVLNCKISRRRTHHTRGRWRNKDFDSHLYSDDKYKLVGDDSEDYCIECWNDLFDAGLGIEVEEPDYYVEERKREEYYCDLCGDGMGDRANHEVSLNPRLIESVGKLIARDADLDWKERLLTNELEESVKARKKRSSVDSRRDECYDCCDECAGKIFGYGVSPDGSTRSSNGLLHAVGSGITSVCIQMKRILYA